MFGRAAHFHFGFGNARFTSKQIGHPAATPRARMCGKAAARAGPAAANPWPRKRGAHKNKAKVAGRLAGGRQTAARGHDDDDDSGENHEQEGYRPRAWQEGARPPPHGHDDDRGEKGE